VIYARQSRDDDRTKRRRLAAADGVEVDSDSVEQQIADGEHLAKKLDIPVRYVFKEPPNTSGKWFPARWCETAQKREKRPALESTLQVVEQAAARGAAVAIIARKRDRLCRSLALSIRLYEWLHKHGATIECTDESSFGNDANGRFALHNLAAMAQWTLDQTTENAKTSKRRAKELGKKMGPVWTFGYRDGAEHGTVEVASDAAGTVREVFQMFIDGATVMDICRWLNETHRGLCRPKINRQDASWHPVTVRRMLENRRYVGLNDDGTKSKLYEAIVAPEMFWKAHELLSARQGIRVTRKEHDRPLRGLLLCGYCNGTLQTINMSPACREVKLYACARTGIPHEHRPFVMRESRWLDFLRAFFVRDIAPEVDSTEVALLKAQSASIDNEIERLAGMLADKQLSAQAYGVATRHLESRRDKLASQLANLPAKREAIDPNDWKKLRCGEQRQLLELFIDRIVVFNGHCDVYRADAPDVPFRFPAMKEPERAKRASTCLCPSGFARAQANAILLGIEGRMRRLTGKPDPARYEDRFVSAQWKPWRSDRFYPATEFAARLVSRRARKRHGLTGGKGYPGRKTTRSVTATAIA
jgi:DNA invertase Pin-like site-specific DNA recombinase